MKLSLLFYLCGLIICCHFTMAQSVEGQWNELTHGGTTFPSAEDLREVVDIRLAGSAHCENLTETSTSCDEFLQRVQAGISSSLAAQIESIEQEVQCLGELCESDWDSELNELEGFQQLRYKQALLDVICSEFENGCTRTAQYNGGSHNIMRNRIGALSDSEQEHVWEEFEKKERQYLANWWEDNRVAEQFSGIENCFAGDDPEFIARRTPSYKLELQIKERRDIDRGYRDLCQRVSQWWRTMPHSLSFLYSLREDIPDEVEQGWIELAPWTYHLKSSISEDTEQEKKEKVSSAKLSLVEDLKKLKDWVDSRDEGSRDELLSLKSLMTSLDVPGVCDDYSRFSAGDLINFIPELITPLNIIKNSFFDSPLNDQFFLAGFIDYSDYEEQRTQYNREFLFSSLLLPIHGVTQISGARKIIGAARMKIDISQIERMKSRASAILNQLRGF